MTDFRNQILALASPANVQLDLFPRGACIGDELVCDFEVNRDDFLANHELTLEQMTSIQALDGLILELSGPDNEAFWCAPEPISDDPRWEQIRELSRQVMSVLGWDEGLPEKDGAIYVFEDRVEVSPDEDEVGS